MDNIEKDKIFEVLKETKKKVDAVNKRIIESKAGYNQNVKEFNKVKSEIIKLGPIMGILVDEKNIGVVIVKLEEHIINENNKINNEVKVAAEGVGTAERELQEVA